MEVLQRLYDSEINFSISCFWDGGFEVKLGDPLNGYRAEGTANTLAEAIDWLDREARRHFPNSVFARAA